MSIKKTVLVSGNFNVLHPGHLRLLRFAKEYGDHLIVAVIADEFALESAHVPEQLRLEGIQCNNWVDEAFITEEPIETVISKIQPTIVVKGKEHEYKDNIEQKAVDSYNGRLIFSSGESIFSSLDLLRKEFQVGEQRDISLPFEYMSRHDIKPLELDNLLQKFKNLNVCVIGDLIIDEYITCEPLGMSQEEPTIVVTPIDHTKFIGGAGIVASHAAGLGSQVEFISISGLDSSRDFALKQLDKYGVTVHLLADDSRPTTLKQRFRSKGKGLLRVSHLHQSSINSILQSQLLAHAEKALKKADVLVFSDFNYGCLPQNLVSQIIEMAKKYNVLLAADSQSSSQVGDISRFKTMDLITPTEREARISTKNHEDGLVVLAESLRSISEAKNIFLKLGGEGLLIHAYDDTRLNNDWLTDKIGAINLSPKDVAGAGDSMLITSALTLAVGGNIWEAACLGSIAAAIQVSRVGNTPLQLDELRNELKL